MTKKKIARKSRKPKATPAKTAETATVSRAELDRWLYVLARAQLEAIKAAPRSVPNVGGGVQASIEAIDAIAYVRSSILDILTRAS
jgi:hypothetical protein